MYVCICNNITEDQVRNVAAKGLSGKDALSHLGIGSGCGICVMEALERFSHEQNTAQQAPTPVAPSNK